MVLAIKRAREHNIPFLGICLGFQMAIVEWARNVCAFEGMPRWLTEIFESIPDLAKVPIRRSLTQKPLTQ
jgi:CTP synthase (UTP-ammonia lyase)